MVQVKFQPLHSMASSIAHDFFRQEANTLSSLCVLMYNNGRDVTWTSHTSRLSTRFEICFSLNHKKWFFTLPQCVFLDFWDARGLGLLFVVCACAVGLRGNRLTGMRGTWGVVWRSAHVPTIPFTWLRRANALGPTAHASNYQALLSIKLCEQCGSNSCVRVFFIPWGHVDNHAHIWAFVTSMGSPDLNARFWLVETIFAALWLVNTY